MTSTPEKAVSPADQLRAAKAPELIYVQFADIARAAIAKATATHSTGEA